ncbi:MAG: hypothetical protein RL141_251 [Candidatus Parcubacteria bacterium]
MPSPLLRRAHEKAQKMFEEDGAINPETFQHFDKQMIKKDLAEVRRLEELFLAESTPETRNALKRATVLEAMIHEQVELNEWLGPDITTRHASRYDDVINGVDSIAELPQPSGPSYLALNMDVTSGPPTKKLQRIRDEINNGTLGSVKYFESTDGAFQGSLSLVPRVVIGVDTRNIERLAELWVNGKQKELANDPIQIQILDEVYMQLKAFRAYAETQGATGSVAAYDRVISIVSGIFRTPQKQELRRASSTQQYLSNDLFYKSLDEELAECFGHQTEKKPERGKRRIISLS